MDQTVRFFLLVCVSVNNLFVLYFWLRYRLFVFFLFTLNLLFSFSLKYLISVQKFDILPFSVYRIACECFSEGVLVCVCFDL